MSDKSKYRSVDSTKQLVNQYSDTQPLILTDEMATTMLKSINCPPEPNQKLLEAKAKHEKTVTN